MWRGGAVVVAQARPFTMYQYTEFDRQFVHQRAAQYRDQLERWQAGTLGDDELRVTDVCFEVGFQSLGSFSTLFHKYVGHAPVTYRENVKQKEQAKRQVPGCFLVMYKLEAS